MTGKPYTIAITRSARRALAEKLPLDVATGAAHFLAEPLSSDPHRVGKSLDRPLDGVHSARLMREWRLLHVIDDDSRVVTVRGIVHRRDAYRSF